MCVYGDAHFVHVISVVTGLLNKLPKADFEHTMLRNCNLNVTDKQPVKEQLMFITGEGKPYRKSYEISGEDLRTPLPKSVCVLATTALTHMAMAAIVSNCLQLCSTPWLA